MEFGIVFHFPLIIIFLPMIAAIITPLLPGTAAPRILSLSVLTILSFIAMTLTITLWQSGGYFTYQMGYFPGPWGNELRAGILESIVSVVFAVVMFVTVLSTKVDIEKDMRPKRQTFFYSMINLLTMSLMALVFTNDIFNAYVFIEVSTIAACAIVVAKETNDTLRATLRYLFLSVMGSGMFLLAVAVLYSITGHLLMDSANGAITNLMATGEYSFPLIVTLLLFVVSIAVKAALFPFHIWLPDAHASATTPASAILSGIVLKAYIILLIKILYRMYGIETIEALGVLPILFVLGIAGIFVGSIMACFQTKLKRLIAYSSVGQIGYIFMGLGLSGQGGFTAASFHIIGHSFTKSMMFIAAGALINSAGSYDIANMSGVARKNIMAGVAFGVGALSMTGIPLFAGFVSKFHLAAAASANLSNMWITMTALTVSAFLSGIYYFPVLFKTFGRSNKAISESFSFAKMPLSANIAFVFLILVNIALGLFFIPILEALDIGFLAIE